MRRVTGGDKTLSMITRQSQHVPPFSALKPDDTIALVSLSNATDGARVDAGAEVIRRAGFVPYVHPVCCSRYGRFSGTDDVRRDALHEVFANPAVKAILAVRGGYGIQRFADSVDYRLIAKNPKPFIGYSDTTTLLNDIPRYAGFPAFHAPMPTDCLSPTMDADNWLHLWRVLRGDPVMPSDHPAVARDTRVVTEGTATGTLWGGNLSLLATNTGTRSQLAKPEILFIEEIGEDLYRFDRMLHQLARSGQLESLKAVLVGDLGGVEDKGEPAFGQTTEEVVESHFKFRAVPFVRGFPAGHGDSRTTLPIGFPVTLTATKGRTTLTHAPLFL